VAEFGQKHEVEGGAWALIGDLVDSRGLEAPARAEAQERLAAALADANGGLDLAADLAITAGDEFEGLAPAPAALVDAAVLVSDALHGLAGVRFGLGFGPLATPLAPRAAVGSLDGPCFHAARRGVDRARELGLWIALEAEDGPLDDGLESLAELLGIERASWTEKQAVTVRLAREHLQLEVAERQGVSPSVISERLKATHFEAVMRAEAALKAGLELRGRA